MRRVFFSPNELKMVDKYLFEKYGNIQKCNLAKELNVSRQSIYYALGNKNQSIDNVALKIKDIIKNG